MAKMFSVAWQQHPVFQGRVRVIINTCKRSSCLSLQTCQKVSGWICKLLTVTKKLDPKSVQTTISDKISSPAVRRGEAAWKWPEIAVV